MNDAASGTSVRTAGPSLAKTMRAWQLPQRGLANLRPVDLPVPRPGPQELLLRVGAVSLNYRDLLIANGRMLPDLEFPLLPASDATGEVVAVGEGVERFRPGDRAVTQFVAGWIDGPVAPIAGRYSGTLGGPLPGALAEYILVREDSAVAPPAGYSDAEAATLPVAALTAWFAFFEAGRLQPGQTVLVQGTGGVALFGLQIAAAAGARIIVTSSSEAKLDRVRALGAWQGINYARNPAWDEAVLDLTGGRGADHIFEIAGGDNMRRSVRATAAGGQISLIGFVGGTQDYAFDAIPALTRQIRIQGIMVGHRKAFEAMNRAIEQAGFKPVIDSTYPFDRAPEAFAHLERGPFGKVVVTLD